MRWVARVALQSGTWTWTRFKKTSERASGLSVRTKTNKTKTHKTPNKTKKLKTKNFFYRFWDFICKKLQYYKQGWAKPTP